MYKIYPYNNLYRASERELVIDLLSTLEGTDVSKSINKIFNDTGKDRNLVNTLMRMFPMGTEKGNLTMAIAESILRIPDNEKRNDLVSQMNIPFVPVNLVRIFTEIFVSLLARTMIAGDSIDWLKFMMARGHPDLASYDMLGESAVTYQQADEYFQKYREAIWALEPPSELSIKLSSLHPRYEYLKQEECVPCIIEKMRRIMRIARYRKVNVTIDAEESDRLDLSMMVIDAIAKEGFLTVAVQANQKRAMGVIKYLNSIGVPIGVRLVKGAYWDTEIKIAQERGLDYPVFTSKKNTNISYLACAKLMLESKNIIPKFATHNPSTVGAVLGLTEEKLEFQRLYGMGTKLHGLIKNIGHDSRIYKPIGEGKELLAYLIRRMIENGANTSFMMHENIENHIDMGIEMDSYESLYHPRPNSGGMDFSDPVALNELKKYHDKKCT